MSRTRVKLLDTAPIPGDDGELGLYQHGEDFVIKVMGGQDLMSTRTHGSADAWRNSPALRSPGACGPAC